KMPIKANNPANVILWPPRNTFIQGIEAKIGTRGKRIRAKVESRSVEDRESNGRSRTAEAAHPHAVTARPVSSASESARVVTKSEARQPQPYFGWRVVYCPAAISRCDWSSLAFASSVSSS